MTLLASGAWKHHSYRQLETLCGRLRDEERRLYWHLAGTYFWASQRRVAYCPRCKQTAVPTRIGDVHKHGHSKSVRLVPKIVRVVSKRVDASLVQRAIDWLESEWKGDVVVPDDLR